MAFLDLPPELLILIALQIGSTELRKSVQYLLISKQWYQAALPVYLAGLQLSTIYLSSYDLDRLPPPHTPLSNLFQKKTERLSIRLVGHPSKQIAQNPWHTKREAGDDDTDDGQEGGKAGWDYWMEAGPVVTNSLEGGRKSYVWHTEEHQLHPWRDRVNRKLIELASILPAFKDLKELSFEASSEDDPTLGPRWDYLYRSTMKAVISNLPVGLQNLTLDTCGSAFAKSDQDREPVHLCSLLALRLSDIQQVRLRMRHICPQVLDTSNDLCGTSSIMKSLVIRLSIPFFPEASYEQHNGQTEHDAVRCEHFRENKSLLYEAMIDEGTNFAKMMEPDVMRISYRDPEFSGINLYVADCVNEVYLHDPSEIFTYEDDGRAWGAWEEDDNILLAGDTFANE